MTDWFNPAIQIEAIGHRAARLLHSLAQLVNSGTPFSGTNIECSRLSAANTEYVVAMIFHERLKQIMRSNPSIYPVMKLVCDVYILTRVERNIGDYTEDGYLNYQQATWCREAVKKALSDMIPEAVGLVDAWEFSDFELNSTLGRSDGKVYEAIFEATLSDPVNQGKNGKAISLGYEEYIRPILKGERFSKKGNSSVKSKL